MINYSAIPNSPKPWTPWKSLLIAIAIVGSMLAALGIGALATTHIKNRDTGVAAIFLLFFCGFLVTIVRSFQQGYGLFKSQKRWMAVFAKDNNWKYDDSKRSIGDLSAIPPSLHIGSPWSNVRCTVSGQLDGVSFELAHITYMQPRGLANTLATGYTSRPAWVSILRLNGHPTLHENPLLLYDQDATHTYIICPLNALYAHDIQAMFGSLAV